MIEGLRDSFGEGEKVTVTNAASAKVGEEQCVDEKTLDAYRELLKLLDDALVSRRADGSTSTDR